MWRVAPFWFIELCWVSACTLTTGSMSNWIVSRTVFGMTVFFG